MEPSNQTSSAIPIAIICGFALIALAIFFTDKTSPSPITSNEQNPAEATKTTSIRPIDKTDYIRGNPNAPILIVEYSDYDCPFCKQYHATLNQILNEYGVTGKVAWVYRQFPLAEMHPNSPKISEAALCVGSIAGNDAFWQFSDLIFNERDIDDATNVTRLPDYAEKIGVSKDEYIACLDSKKMEQAVVDSITDGHNAGVRGTPYTVFIAGNQQTPIEGAQSYDIIKSIVANLVDQLQGDYEVEATTTTPAE